MSSPYGMPPSSPVPPAAPQKNRTGLYVGIACGCLLLIVVLVAAGGVGLWLFSSGGDEDPTARPTSSDSAPEEPSEDPSEDPSDAPTDEESEDPLETPSEDPAEDPTSQEGASFEITVSPPEEGTTLDTGSEKRESTNGKFIGVQVTLANTGGQDIGMSLDSFTFLDVDGTEYEPMHGVFSTMAGIAPGEEGEMLLYADVPADAELESITYTDDVGTGGETIEFAVGG